MKTLREYIDQLDEISRRDFLKGAGAAAIGAAGGYVGGVKKMTNKAAAQNLGMIYGFFGDAPELYSVGSPFNTLLRQTIEELSYFEQRLDPDIKHHPWFDYGKDQGEREFQSKFGNIKEFSKDDMARFRAILNTHIQHFKEAAYSAMEESVDEAASPDAVRRIEQLIQYK